MARGDAPMALEYLAPYFRGARYAVVALRRRHPDVAELQPDAERYLAMVDRYSAAAIATYRLKRAEQK